MTIKELRAKEAARLAARENENPTIEQIEAAAHTMRIFYRFAAAYLASFYVGNDRRSTSAQIEEAEAKEKRAYTRAADALKRYGLKISTPGLYPIIEDFNGVNFSYCHYYNY